MQANKPELKRVEFVGPQVGKELASDGALALLSVVIGIVAYLALRFEWRFAVSAIIANLHDVVIILGFFALFQWEFSLPVLAAVLAVLGYSVNESVVVFDRVRETFKKKRGLTTPQVLDHAITSTISRTVITHGCTQMMVTPLRSSRPYRLAASARTAARAAETSARRGARGISAPCSRGRCAARWRVLN